MIKKWNFTVRIVFSLILNTGSGILLAQRTAPVAYDANTKVNYERTWEAVIPETNPNNITTLSGIQQFRMTTQYVDGLGRPFQTVIKQGSLTTSGTVNADLVTAIDYDQYGVEQFKYLPFSANNTGGNTSINDGLFKQNPFQQQATFCTTQYPGETYYYGQNVYEPSPLKRTQEDFAAGNSWVGTAGNAIENNRHSIKSKHWVNTATDAVRIWTVTNSGTLGVLGSYASTTTYGAGLLRKEVTVDEIGDQVIEFKDKDDKLILKKVQLTATADNGSGSSHTGWLCTYYIYDDLNNLRCVIQPRGVELISSLSWALTDATILAEQCFRYEYDSRNRMIVKKVPGAGQVNMVYDALDRLVMTQDANLAAITPTPKWHVTLYDALSRPVQTGLLLNTWNNKTFQQNLAAAAVSTAYPFASTSTPSATYWETLTFTHYDDYAGVPSPLTGSLNTTYINSTNFITTYNASPDYAQQIAQSPQTKGMVTWTQSKVLGTSSQFISQVNFYDDKGRLIQVQTVNQTGGIDIATTQYDFSGKVLRSHLFHQKASAPAQSYQVATKNTYDILGRVIKIEKNVNNTGFKVISALEYDALGQLKKKSLGTNPATALPLETLSYDYNIRGWLLGANRDFAKTGGSTTNYFGFDLGYDKNTIAPTGGSSIGTYTTPAYNGNIGGMVWKSSGDGQIRKYDFTYDAVNRLMKADFNQYTAGTFNKTANIDFSSKMGDGTTPTSAYDANGNILSMTQNGFKLNSSPVIDQLTYTYQTNTNKLSKVTDAANDNTSMLGDFKYDPATKGTTDYSYDANGNLTLDNNKKISSITYNYLNLPSIITVTGKGTITYTYDASGNKLQKTTVDNTVSPSKTTNTAYISGFVYQNDTLQFLPDEEGRIRWALHKYTNGTSAYGFEYDFFLKDHLGNTRMVLTQEKDTAKYMATMEAAYRTTENSLFFNIPQSSYPRSSVAGYPTDNTTVPNDSLVRLNGSGQKVGPSIILKVMSGDVVDIAAKSYWVTNSSTTNSPSINDVLNSLANGIVTLTGGSKGTLSQLNTTTSPLYTSLNSFINANNPAIVGKPKAYLNWILLDEQFNYVSSYPQSGAIPVSNFAAGTLGTPGYTGIPITKSGYLYIYVSNETQNWDVFFDNLTIQHRTGPVTEETHYYPFGLTMAGISSKAAGEIENKYRYNKGSELQNKEFSDGSGLELYATNFRSLDPQLGRFWQLDPMDGLSQNTSLYSYGGNNPISFNDPMGLWKDSIKTSKGEMAYANQPWNEGIVITAKPKLEWFYWPEYHSGEAMWHNIMIGRLRDGKRLVQGNEPKWVLNNLNFYKKFYQNDLDYRKMQLAAVLIEMSPVLLEITPELLTISQSTLPRTTLEAAQSFINEVQLNAWLRSAVALNVAKQRIALALIAVLGKDASPEMLQKINEWATKFSDPAKVGEQGIKLFEKWDDIKDVVHNIKDVFK